MATYRYNAVVYPLKYNSEKTKNQKRKYILATWLISFLLSFIQLFIYKCNPNTDIDNKIETNNSKFSSYCYCQEIWDIKNVTDDSKYYLGKKKKQFINRIL